MTTPMPIISFSMVCFRIELWLPFILLSPTYRPHKGAANLGAAASTAIAQGDDPGDGRVRSEGTTGPIVVGLDGSKGMASGKLGAGHHPQVHQAFHFGDVRQTPLASCGAVGEAAAAGG